jgi:plasmid stabilization system protein ParE
LKNYSLKITQIANEDFEDILHYTLTEYGELQMEKYADKILNSFQSIKTQPFLGKQALINGKGHFIHFVGKHTVFYKVNINESSIFIIRILHQKMNFIKHL